MGILIISFLITAVFVFVLLYFIFRKYTSVTNPSKSIGYWLSVVVATPVLYFGIICIWLLLSSQYDAKIFNEENWSTNENTRYEYVDDLIENEKLIGLTIAEVKAMLGEEDNIDDSTITYYIGYSPKYFLNMDPDWLEAKLVDGKVQSVRIRE